ncbi:MAG: hypothetical protein U0324_13430 [Polyangiales bacterium]
MGAAVRKMAARRAQPAAAAGVALGVVEASAGDGQWRVRVGAAVYAMACDPSVDPRVVDEAAASGARVVVDLAAEPVIVGALVTARPVTVGRDGVVSLEVKRFVVTAAEEALLRTRSAFVQVKGADVESYGNRVVSRARELLKVLGRNVRIN